MGQNQRLQTPHENNLPSLSTLTPHNLLTIVFLILPVYDPTFYLFSLFSLFTFIFTPENLHVFLGIPYTLPICFPDELTLSNLEHRLAGVEKRSKNAIFGYHFPYYC